MMRLLFVIILLVIFLTFFLPLRCNETPLLLINVVPSLVSNDDNSFLLRVPLDVDIKDMVFSMDPHSASGLNDFTGLFYKHCWDIISRDVYSVVRQFFISLVLF